MLGVNQLDFINYANALKGNYRKGVHKMEAIMASPTHAKEFAGNMGGVSVVLSVPIGREDRNSDKLLELLLASDVADDAVETWLHQFYEFSDWDDLLSDASRCKEMADNPLIWRAAGGSKLAVGKSVATLAGLSCADYKDIDAVAASSVAMAAVAASSVAMTAVAASQVAMTAVAASSVAMTAIANAWETTENIFAKSTVALNALKNSGKCKTVTKDVRGNSSVSFYSGLCFVFTAQITVTGGACTINASRPTGSNTITMCNSVTTATVNKFCKNPYVQCTASSHSYADNVLYFYAID